MLHSAVEEFVVGVSSIFFVSLFVLYVYWFISDSISADFIYMYCIKYGVYSSENENCFLLLQIEVTFIWLIYNFLATLLKAIFFK